MLERQQLKLKEKLRKRNMFSMMTLMGMVSLIYKGGTVGFYIVWVPQL